MNPKWKYRLGKLLGMAFFPAAFIWLECLLRAWNPTTVFIAPALLRILLFSIGYGLAVYFVLQLIPSEKMRRIAGLVLLILVTVLMGVEVCCKYMLKTYFTLEFMLSMSGQIAGGFAGTALESVTENIPYILLSLLPTVVYIVFWKRRKFVRKNPDLVILEGDDAAAGAAEKNNTAEESSADTSANSANQEENVNSSVKSRKYRSEWVLPVLNMGDGIRRYRAPLLALCGAIVTLAAACWLSVKGNEQVIYTYGYSANSAVPQFGELTALRLEMKFKLFGMPEPPEFHVVIQPEEEDAEPEPIVYGYNEMDIDFEALAASAQSGGLKTLDEYFGKIEPSQQNEYTGKFAGKNFVHITAEGFSPYAISQDLTPTLYRLTHEGFVFTDSYQPGWNLSTTGGEFSNMTGVIPTWYNGGVSPRLSGNDFMPFGFGWQFRELGYTTVAYHNSDYAFYHRDTTHPNFGYDYYGIGNGLDIASKNNFPESDQELFEAVVPPLIKDYVENGQRFHLYCMTVSGHGRYSWKNPMATKHKEELLAKREGLSEPVAAYLAANLDLEAGLKFLVDSLEAAGIAEDTVIVMTADHYPYMLSDTATDYYNELTGLNDSERSMTRYKNTIMCWAGDMKEPVIVDTPISSIDIYPTVANLFGLTYDSRLLSGRDIFATNYVENQVSTCMPLVILPVSGGYSWITAAGSYDAMTGQFTAREGIEVDASYASTVSALVAQKYKYAGDVIGLDYYQHVFGKTDHTGFFGYEKLEPVDTTALKPYVPFGSTGEAEKPTGDESPAPDAAKNDAASAETTETDTAKPENTTGKAMSPELPKQENATLH